MRRASTLRFTSLACLCSVSATATRLRLSRLAAAFFHPEVGEYGAAELHVNGGALFEGTPADQTVWMSHFDAVRDVRGFTVVASTTCAPWPPMENAEKKIFTTQFHPEVKHTEYGQQILSNFLFNICGLRRTGPWITWSRA